MARSCRSIENFFLTQWMVSMILLHRNSLTKMSSKKIIENDVRSRRGVENSYGGTVQESGTSEFHTTDVLGAIWYVR
jgi:hypothetical protein